MTCLICFAIAKCTQAASIYLDKIKQNNEKTSATNQPKKICNLQITMPECAIMMECAGCKTLLDKIYKI